MKSGIYQSAVLILASFVFYGWHYPLLVTLLLVSILVNTGTSFWVIRLAGTARKRVAILGVVANLMILFFFKYGPLVGKTLFPEGSSISLYLIAIPLPIGISFFTFQGISLVIDTFRENDRQLLQSSAVPWWRHLLNVFLFKSFFPQLIAGPIVKAHEFMPQIRLKRIRDIDVDFTARKLILGYFLKMVVADNLKDQTFWMAYPYFESYAGMDLLGLLFGYSMQIFADFAGYSLIAIGLASLFGYQFAENFLFPYSSTSFAEFWQRWHISLSSFLKEYLYIPLGGNRRGEVKTYRNLFITMVLGGLWHGAAWSYAVWGAYHGLALAVERYLGKYIQFRKTPLVTFLQGCLVFSLVSLGWLFFKLPDFSQALLYIQRIIVAPFYSTDKERLLMIALYSAPVITYHIAYVSKKAFLDHLRPILSPVVYATLLFMIMLNSGSSGDFIYFQF
ncbi:MBOAT family O-acyltransferase [Spirosoma fluviale]|uniref:MBOAT family O-acyltransferase n=1 Tax=Spirosoma fluviale TaxID=1597977 RepID=UPI001FE7896F|nr:MBOAT family O-acyltransferase [Spirosoma fluviale]